MKKVTNIRTKLRKFLKSIKLMRRIKTNSVVLDGSFSCPGETNTIESEKNLREKAVRTRSLPPARFIHVDIKIIISDKLFIFTG